jgi:hypothetical protein
LISLLEKCHSFILLGGFVTAISHRGGRSVVERMVQRQDSWSKTTFTAHPLIVAGGGGGGGSKCSFRSSACPNMLVGGGGGGENVTMPGNVNSWLSSQGGSQNKGGHAGYISFKSTETNYVMKNGDGTQGSGGSSAKSIYGGGGGGGGYFGGGAGMDSTGGPFECCIGGGAGGSGYIDRNLLNRSSPNFERQTKQGEFATEMEDETKRAQPPNMALLKYYQRKHEEKDGSVWLIDEIVSNTGRDFSQLQLKLEWPSFIGHGGLPSNPGHAGEGGNGLVILTLLESTAITPSPTVGPSTLPTKLPSSSTSTKSPTTQLTMNPFHGHKNSNSPSFAPIITPSPTVGPATSPSYPLSPTKLPSSTSTRVPTTNMLTMNPFNSHGHSNSPTLTSIEMDTSSPSMMSTAPSSSTSPSIDLPASSTSSLTKKSSSKREALWDVIMISVVVMAVFLAWLYWCSRFLRNGIASGYRRVSSDETINDDGEGSELIQMA